MNLATSLYNPTQPDLFETRFLGVGAMEPEDTNDEKS